jgi:fructose transport system ATP-binding protein
VDQEDFRMSLDQTAASLTATPIAGPQPILSAQGLQKRYGRVVALDNADFELMPGEILAVIGDNGAGKTSLIKALCGAMIPDAGTIKLDGSPVHFKSPMDARMAGIETVYQNLALSPALSIADNLFLGREMRKPGPMGSIFRLLDRSAMNRTAREKLSELGLMTIQNINQSVETLSGGQRQGVAVARAAAFGSKVVIMDEPTAARAGADARRQAAGHADRADLAQHAACLRSGGPHPYPPAGQADRGDQPQGLYNVRCRGDHDRRHAAARQGVIDLPLFSASGRSPVI